MKQKRPVVPPPNYNVQWTSDLLDEGRCLSLRASITADDANREVSRRVTEIRKTMPLPVRGGFRKTPKHLFDRKCGKEAHEIARQGIVEDSVKGALDAALEQRKLTRTFGKDVSVVDLVIAQDGAITFVLLVPVDVTAPKEEPAPTPAHKEATP